MKIPSPPSKIKPASRKILVGGLACLALGTVPCVVGCLPVARRATFPARSDTVELGSLLGPFDGRVVDGATGKPVAGALVYASWGFESGHGLVAPSGGLVQSQETDSDGRYQIDALTTFPGFPGRGVRLERFTLIVYRRGYVAYRSDRLFETMAERHDFSQKLNQVKLERFPNGQSHARHVRFVGGSGPLRQALESEIVQASLELAGETGTAPSSKSTGAEESTGEPLLDASVLLSADELKAATGFDGSFEVGRLANLPRSPVYDSRHFRALGRAESFDTALRVWKLPNIAAAEARFSEVKRTMPNQEPLAGVGSVAVRGHDGPIRAILTIDRERHLVLDLTCGVDQCHDPGQLEALMRRLLSRADRLGRPVQPPTDGESSPVPGSDKPSEAAKPAPTEPEPEENPFRLRPPELHR